MKREQSPEKLSFSERNVETKKREFFIFVVQGVCQFPELAFPLKHEKKHLKYTPDFYKN